MYVLFIYFQSLYTISNYHVIHANVPQNLHNYVLLNSQTGKCHTLIFPILAYIMIYKNLLVSSDNHKIFIDLS